jgi:mRNA interferase MazF
MQFDPQVGSEQAGKRPALVVSGDSFNVVSTRLTVVMPLTSRERGWPTHVSVSPEETNGLTRPSWVLTEQIQGAAIERFERRVGVVAPELLYHVRETFMRWVLQSDETVA